MIENLPIYVVVVFILATLLTVGIFQNACKRGDFSAKANNYLGFLLPFGLLFQAILAFFGFYKVTETFPPRLILFGVLPSILVIIVLFIFSKKFINKLPLKTLTIIHIIRIPVEIVLYWLFVNKQIPQIMTFEGRNFDILIGLTAPIIFWLAFRNNSLNRWMLIVWNIFGLVFLTNIVVHAALSIPSNFQQFGFDQPNVAVLNFPFIWLPTIIVPIVLFSHLASIYKLFSKVYSEN